MKKIKITFTNAQIIKKINTDCIILEKKKKKDGQSLNITYELYGFSEITNPLEGTCFLEVKKGNTLKYCIVSDNFDGQLPLSLADEFYNTFSKK